MNAMKKQWFVEERQHTRARLMKQHEKVMELEAKAGIKKDYQAVGLSLAEKSLGAAIGLGCQLASLQNHSYKTSPVLSQD